MREVVQENKSKPDTRRMMSECRLDGVFETMEFKNLTYQVAQVDKNCIAEWQVTSLEKHMKLRFQLFGAEGAGECVLTLRGTHKALWRRHQLS